MRRLRIGILDLWRFMPRRNGHVPGFLVGLALLSCTTDHREIVLASTTSTYDSGLFEVLLPTFHHAHPEYRVHVVAVGSGQALAMARRGDADVVLAHSPRAEEEFMANGHGESRRRVMFNDFVIVGPGNDPAAVRGLSDASSALARIAGASALFISRGDESGTHNKERELWSAAGIEPRGDWYLEVGQGMGSVLIMASEQAAYTLTDRGTYLSFAERLQLAVLVEGDPLLRNQYSVILVRGAANFDGARAFTNWLTSPEGQMLIGQFGVDRFGRPLFAPNANLVRR